MTSINKTSESDTEEHYEPNVYFKPVVNLPIVEVITHEEDESTLLKLRSKLFRYDNQASPPEWKERGTGDVKLMHNIVKNTVRVVMRRDKTLKLCANHFVTPAITLSKPSSGRKHWWIWSVPQDYADEVPKSEIFAIKFSSEENAILWKEKFEEAKKLIEENKNNVICKDSDEDKENRIKKNKETEVSSDKKSTKHDDNSDNDDQETSTESEDSFQDALDKTNSGEEHKDVSKSLNKLNMND